MSCSALITCCCGVICKKYDSSTVQYMMTQRTGTRQMMNLRLSNDDKKMNSNSLVANCSGCKIAIRSKIHLALGRQWHVNCFRCCQCLSTTPNHYLSDENLLFCKRDYVAKFGEICQRCKQQITGPLMIAGEQKYHTECFICTKCMKVIGYGDEYMLFQRHNLYCNHCYKQTLLPAISTPSVHQLGNLHTIHHIKLTPSPGGQRKFTIFIERPNITTKRLQVSQILKENEERKSFIAIENVDASSELKAKGVKSGDKILEVNDIMVTDDTVDRLSQIITNPSKVHTITIERNIPDEEEAKPACVVEEESGTNAVPAAQRTTVARQISLDLLGTSDYDKKFKNRNQCSIDEDDIFDCNGMPSPESDMTRRARKKAERANSLPRSKSTDKTYHKCNSPLVRSQSMKTGCGQVFRPSDLIIGEVIGKGCFGKVSKVVHRGSGKVMVLKELTHCGEKAQKQFIKEVTLLKTLDHPNVLKFIGILYKDKILSFIAEYIAGGTLRGILKNQARDLSWSQRVKFAKDIACGMEYLHSNNVIHRDLKSKNCLARKDEASTIVVADFGLAGFMSIGDDTNDKQSRETTHQNTNNPSVNGNHTHSRPNPPKKRTTVVGSPYWMAPEMIKGKAYDERVDIFSFGIIVCEIISRVKADPDFIPRTKVFGLDEEAFKEKFCQECPDAFFQIACFCCNIDPTNRPPFSSLASWLESLLAHLEVGMPLLAEFEGALLGKTTSTVQEGTITNNNQT